MCIASVPKRPDKCQSRTHAGRSSDSGSCSRNDRSKGRRQARQRHREDVQTIRAANRAARLEEARDAASGPSSWVSLLELCSSHTGGRRKRPRTRGLVLGNLERERLRRQLEVAGECGTHYGAFRRFFDRGPEMIEQRLVCQHLCGSRVCEQCDKAIRERECGRVSGSWRQFFTLGMPAGGMVVRQAWHRIRRARALLIKRLERHASRDDSWAVRIWQEDVEHALSLRANSKRARNRLCPLDYAWCIEPHHSGFPHLHFVLNTCYVNFDWLRAVWSDCIGRACRWMLAEQVWNEDGICYYLSKYISKTVLPVDLCAVMYRQRLWGTSLPMKEKPESAWMREADSTEGEAAYDSIKPEEWNREAGFSLEISSEGKYAIWSRATSLLDDAGAALAWERAAKHAMRPEKPDRVERPEEWRVISEWPLFDLLLESAYIFLTKPGSLTFPVKVLHTCASTS